MDYGVFPVEDIFVIKGRNGVVVTGKVAEGRFRVGDDVIIIRKDGSEINSKIKSIEIFGHIECAEKGDNVGVMLQNIVKEDINQGDIRVLS